MRSALILLLGLVLLQPFNVYAEDAAPVADATEPVIPKPLKVMPSKIKPVQTNSSDELSKAAPEPDNTVSAVDMKALEALSPRPSAGFQGDFWEGMKRADIAAFLAQPSPVTKHPSVRHLMLKAVLTPTPELTESKTPDDNIYALRLKRLVELGDFADAQKLYKSNEGEPPTSLAAIAGIEASLGSGEIAVACLDQKTFDKTLKTVAPALWGNIDIFCQALLSPVAGDDDLLRLSNASRAYIELVKPTVASAEDINNLDVMATIALSEIGGLSAYINDTAQLQKINDKHLAILLTHSKPSYSTVTLLAEGLTRGMVDNDKAIAFLKAVDLKDTSNDYAAFLKEYFKNPAAPAVSDALLELANTPAKEALLYPLYSESEMAIPAAHKKKSIKLLILTNQEPAPALVKEAFPAQAAVQNDTPESTVNNDESGVKILIESLLKKVQQGDEKTPNSSAAALLALDYANYPQKDIKNAYDNLLSLTPDGNYVMPIGDILSSLKKSADKKQINQVVIRSLAIIDDKPLDQLHPVALYRILEALNSAGLNEETTSLTHDALGYQMKKLK